MYKASPLASIYKATPTQNTDACVIQVYESVQGNLLGGRTSASQEAILVKMWTPEIFLTYWYKVV